MSHVVNDLAHPHECGLLQTFGCADDHHFGTQVRREFFEQCTAVLRRHGADNELGAIYGVGSIGRYGDAVRNTVVWEEDCIDAGLGYAFAYPCFVRPEPNAVPMLAAEGDR